MKRAVALIAVALWSSACGIGPVGAWESASTPPFLIEGFGDTVALPNGRVGVFGDIIQSTGQPVGRTLIYESSGNRWVQGAAIPEARYADAVAVLADGEVLFAGGIGYNSATLKSTYVYDPGHDAWRRTSDLNAPRSQAEATLLSDGRVLVVGGTSDNGAELFDPTSGNWSSAGTLYNVGAGEIVAALPGGDALVAGGCAGTGFGFTPSATDHAEVLVGATRTWRPVHSLPQPRCGAAATTLEDGKVLVVGGWSVTGGTLEFSSTSLLFDPKKGDWTSAGGSSAGSFSQRAIVAPPMTTLGHQVFVPVAASGRRNGRISTVVVGGQLYDAPSGSWSFTTSTAANTAAQFGSPEIMAVVPLGPNRVLVLLENVALIYDAGASPPQTAVLDSWSLTRVLLAIAIALALAIGLVLVVIRRPAR